MEALEEFDSLAPIIHMNTGKVKNLHCDSYSKKTIETIKQALRESHALRQEPSEEMMENVGWMRDDFEDDESRNNHHKQWWKAMRDQLIKDVENE